MRVLAPDRRYIESELDELEREDFTRLKKVKDGNARKAKAAKEAAEAAGEAASYGGAPELGEDLMAGYDAAADPDVVF